MPSTSDSLYPPPLPTSDEPPGVVGALVDLLADLGVRESFGLLGGAAAPLYHALTRGPFECIHCRHEAGAAFAACEASLAGDRPAAVFTTTGPGLMNALNGIAAARWEGAHVVLLSGATAASRRARWAFQETSAHTLDASLFSSGPLFHFATMVNDPRELEVAAARLAAGFARPEGFVAHLSVPLDVQTAQLVRALRAPPIEPAGRATMDRAAIARCAEAFERGPTAIWVGYGARHAAPLVRALAERTGAAVFSSPRGKGIFPETHPQFVGVTGLGGHAHVKLWVATNHPRRILVLGSRLGEFTSFWDPDLAPPDGFIHVDVRADVPGTAYPSTPTLAVQADVGAFVEALLEALPAARPHARPKSTPPRARTLEYRTAGRVRPDALMQAVQHVVVEGSDAIVLSEAGNAFAWTTHALRFDVPGRYRVSTGYGSMGHAVAGVVGASLATGKKAVAIVGDGAMLMINELSTAVAHAIPAVWVVLNDARFGMTEQGMRSIGREPQGLDIPEVDFVAFARALGAEGVTVAHESELEPALRDAMAARVPFVVDVRIDPGVHAPFGARNQSLIDQGASKPDRRAGW